MSWFLLGMVFLVVGFLKVYSQTIERQRKRLRQMIPMMLDRTKPTNGKALQSMLEKQGLGFPDRDIYLFMKELASEGIIEIDDTQTKGPYLQLTYYKLPSFE